MDRSAHILLVEDNRMDIELTLDAFSEARLQNSVHVVPNGQEALSYHNGANSYLVKPVSFEGFMDIVRQIEGYWLSLNVGPPEGES
ncbi:MAG: hypothetical protein HY739_15645 [Desulfobacterales bacterium]|nr:hypothetical protein [Desulfobacterales bacterium]